MPRVKLFDRDDVLNKAKDLFWQKGYHATSMQDIVSTLGISRSSLYDTFGGKKQLFDESLALYCSSNKTMTEDFLAPHKLIKPTLHELFELVVLESLDDNQGKGCFVVNSTTELADRDTDVKKELIKNNIDFEIIIYNFLLAGQQRGEIAKEKDVRAITNLIYIMISGLKVVGKVESRKEKLMQSVNIMLSLLD